VADSCRRIAGGAGGAIPNFADGHPDIGESNLRVGIATATEALVLAGPPNGERGSTSSTISTKQAGIEMLVEGFISRGFYIAKTPFGPFPKSADIR